MRDEDTRDILRGDGIHLTPRGGELAAREKKQTGSKQQQQHQQPKTISQLGHHQYPHPHQRKNSRILVHPKKIGRTFIGKGGVNIKKSRKNTLYQSTYMIKKKTQTIRESQPKGSNNT